MATSFKDRITTATFTLASAANAGLVSTAAQTFAGAKTFSGAGTFSSTLAVTGASTFSEKLTIQETSNAELELNSNSNPWQVAALTTDQFRIRQNGADKLAIDASGNFNFQGGTLTTTGSAYLGKDTGIGMTSGAQGDGLHIMASDASVSAYRSTAALTLEDNGATELQFFTTSTGTSQIRFGEAADNFVGGIVAHGSAHSTYPGEVHIQDSAGVSAILVGAAGDVGIGDNDSTSYKLVVKSGASSETGLKVHGGATQVGTSSVSHGEIQVGAASANALFLAYDNTNGDAYITNSYDNTAGDIFFQLRTAGTAITPLTLRPTGFRIQTAGPVKMTDSAISIDTFVLGDDGSAFFDQVYSDTVTSARDLQIQSDGQIGYVTSVRASKTNIEKLDDCDWVLDLEPSSFYYRKRDAEGNWLDEPTGELQYGLIAEEAEQVNRAVCIYDEDKLTGVHYKHLITPIISQLKKLAAKVEAQEVEIAQLKGAQ